MTVVVEINTTFYRKDGKPVSRSCVALDIFTSCSNVETLVSQHFDRC